MTLTVCFLVLPWMRNRVVHAALKDGHKTVLFFTFFTFSFFFTFWNFAFLYFLLVFIVFCDLQGRKINFASSKTLVGGVDVATDRPARHL